MTHQRHLPTAHRCPSRFYLMLPLCTAVLAALWWWLGRNLERLLNRVRPIHPPLPIVTPAAQTCHAHSLVIDLHADSLLFERDLLQRSQIGHIDLPRLQAGNVAVQVLAAATRIPLGFNVERTDGRRLDLLILSGYARRSAMARRTPLQRALAHAAQLEAFVAGSGGELRLLRHQEDLADLLAARAQNPRLVGTVLAIEGSQALDGDPANLDALYTAGYRLIGLTHFYDTEFAGSAHGLDKGGLTALGRELLAGMAARQMILDLAHLSPAAFTDVLALWRGPLLVSHGGVRATCDNERNLSDEQIRAVAAAGGVMGVGYWETAVNGRHPRHIIAALSHIITLVGDDYAALGSDFDGGITTAFDTSQLAVLTQEMLTAGFAQTTIRKILGGNALRLLQTGLPHS